jgi:Raf kinase inhibitor-like YbhB/YbcL family protein
MRSATSAIFHASLAMSFSCNASSTTIQIDDDSTVHEGHDRDAGDLESDADPSVGRDPDAMPPDGNETRFTLTSSALADGEAFDPKHTCEGADVSPPLLWKNAPQGTKSFTLVLTALDDQVFGDLGPFVQWALFNIPQAFQGLPENVGNGPMPNNVPGASQVRAWSAFGGVVGGNHYLGPCPREPGRYQFALYALDVETLDELDTSQQPRVIANRVETLEHVLAVATLSASYAPAM